MSILDFPLDGTPIAVVDLETTGLSPTIGSRIIELAVVRVESGRAPELVLDTLVDPQGPVYATEIHGITDQDVVGAPVFQDLAAEFVHAVAGAVIATYNVAFDMRFLDAELKRVPRTATWIPPHLCLMYLRPLLGLGNRCTLTAACQSHGLPGGTHRASDDARLAAGLWERYRSHAIDEGLKTFGDLRGRKAYKFTGSFSAAAYPPGLAREIGPVPCPTGRKPRAEPSGLVVPGAQPSRTGKRRAYWHALVDVFADSEATNTEIESLLEARRELDLEDPEIRAIHARFAGQWLAAAAEDDSVTPIETGILVNVFDGLRRLGWAPGDA